MPPRTRKQAKGSPDTSPNPPEPVPPPPQPLKIRVQPRSQVQRDIEHVEDLSEEGSALGAGDSMDSDSPEEPIDVDCSSMEGQSGDEPSAAISSPSPAPTNSKSKKRDRTGSLALSEKARRRKVARANASVPNDSGEDDTGSQAGSESDLPTVPEISAAAVAKKAKGKKDKPKAKEKGGKSTGKTGDSKNKGKDPKPDPPSKIALVVPQSGSDSNRRITLELSSPFDMVLDSIYDTIGCADVKRKPELSYKLSTAAQKVKPILLGGEDDWEGLMEEVEQLQMKKKAIVPINISVSEQYMRSLSARSGKAASGGAAKGGKRAQAPIIDLDNSEDGDDEDADGGMLEKEQQVMKQLESVHTKCQLCGPTVWCKIGADGKHKSFSFNQKRAWTAALAQGMHGVTLHTPPKSSLFAAFFKHGILDAAPPPPTPAPTSIPHMPPTSTDPFAVLATQLAGTMGMMMGMSQMAGGSPFTQFGSPNPSASRSMPQPRRTPAHYDIPVSSDAPDGSEQVQFPTILELLAEMDDNPEKGHCRHMLQYGNNFASKDFVYIDELKNYKEEDIERIFGLSLGNAKALCRTVKAKLKAIRGGI